jgi:hypothetical protein
MQTSRANAQLFQTAFIVADLKAEMARYVEAMRVGPWFVRESFTPAGARYRGRETGVVMSVAFAWRDDMMLELIQQHDDSPSVFRDAIEKRGHGLHHLGMGVDDYDGALAEYEAQGWKVAFYAKTSGRLGMLERDGFPYLLELLEMDPQRTELFAAMRAAARDWNGAEPVRRM